MKYLGQVQDLSWASPSRIFATTQELLDSQPNYEHEVAIAMDTGIKYQGVENRVGGWAFANSDPTPLVPFPDPPLNDNFTVVFLEFDGLELSNTFPDTNAAGKPRTWTRLTGFGGITNVGEKFYPGALRLDGRTVITAPDAVDFDLNTRDFTFRGYFLCDFPLGEARVLAAKSDRVGSFVFFLVRDENGHFSAGVDSPVGGDDAIVTRGMTLPVVPPQEVHDRTDTVVVSRFQRPAQRFGVTSTTVYSDVTNVGWHGYRFARHGGVLALEMDGMIEDTEIIGNAVIGTRPGPLTIAGYSQPRQGYMFNGMPWVGGLSRFAIDFDIAR